MLRNDDGMDQLVAFLVPAELRRRRPRAEGAARQAARDAAALHGAGALRGDGGAAAPRPPARSTATMLKKTPLDARRNHRGAGRAAHRDRGQAARSRQGGAAAAEHPLRRRLLHRSRRPLAARRALFSVSCARRRALASHHPAGRLRRAHAARDGGAARRPRRYAGPGARSVASTPPPLLRRFLCGLAQALMLPVILGAHRRPMARRVHQLHAADRPRRQMVAGDRDAARRLCAHQRQHDLHHHRRQMARDRAHQARPLSALGRLLLPLVGRAALRRRSPT